ncbi:unnamed protein product [Paramecium primaurelia]|uniref:Uncharacterized protein n=1 Tax=Paramecium primaurelia TaxID=5886 RepID=A0A8S1MUB6_PARPR|nr:unnamed protein product [Paramecium primaurelia]
MFFNDTTSQQQIALTPDSKITERVKIPQTQTKQQIIEHHQSINKLLEKMNETIGRIFKTKEDELRGNIKQQIDEAQAQVIQLTNETTEDQVQRKLKEKRQEIEEERQKILQSSMEFSNKCIEYKNSLSKVMTTTKDLISEIQFLDTQLMSAKITNQQLKKQLENIQTNTVNQDYFSHESTYRQPEIPGMDIEGVNEQYQKAEQELIKTKKIYENIEQVKQDQAFEENQIEKIFLECVQKVKQHKLNTEIQKVQQQSKNPRQLLKPIQSLKQFHKQTEALNQQDFIFSDIEFNDIHKKMIFDEFLSRNEIKALIYNLL